MERDRLTPDERRPLVPRPPALADHQDSPGSRWWRTVIWALVALALALWIFQSGGSQPEERPEQMTYAEFLGEVEADRVESVVIDPEGSIEGELADGTRFVTQGPIGPLPEQDLELLDAHGVSRSYAGTDRSAWGWIGSAIAIALPIAVLVAFWWWLARRGGSAISSAASFGRNPGHVYTTARPSTTFRDVAGYDAVKEDIREVVEFLRDPRKFAVIGARIPKGVLLVGPPGTGKTLIARAVAGEAGVPFISVTGSHFMEMFVGVGAARVRGLFDTARQHAPSIIFVDEIDSIGRTRGAGLGSGHDEREQTLNQLLAEMDGFETTEGIVVMAATNRPDILDPALLRAGRFDRQVLVPLPSLDERVAILEVHCRDKQLHPDVDLRVIARGTPGMSGADLANLVNEAALCAVRSGAKQIHSEHFDAARDRLLMGLRRTSMVLSDEEKRVIAHHEAGHAVMAHLLAHADPIHKVTILPSGVSLGATQQLPTNERHLYERAYLLDTVAVHLAGRVAEELTCDDISTGAANDLVQATEMASRMVRQWAMSDRVAPAAWDQDKPVFLGTDLVQGREYSDATARALDTEVERILTEQHERTRQLLSEHLDALEAVASALMERETIDGADVARLVDEHPPAGGRPPAAAETPRGLPVAAVSAAR